MSYTQHWFRPIEIEQELFNRISEDIEKMQPFWRRKGIKVETSQEVVYIEGFLFPQTIPDEWKKLFVTMKNGGIHQFCNTNRGRFEIAVKAALVIAKHHMGDNILVTSDGGLWNWQGAVEAVKEHLGYGEEFDLTDEAPGYDEMNIKVKWHIVGD